MTAKSISIKGAGGKFGGCALKAVSLIAGDLSYVPESGLRVKRFTLTVRQESAEGLSRFCLMRFELANVLGANIPGAEEPQKRSAVRSRFHRRPSVGLLT